MTTGDTDPAAALAQLLASRLAGALSGPELLALRNALEAGNEQVRVRERADGRLVVDVGGVVLHVDRRSLGVA